MGMCVHPPLPTPYLAALTGQVGTSPIKVRRGTGCHPLSSGCPEVEGLMMKRRGGGAPLTTLLRPHPCLGLAQPVSQVQGRPDLQPALGWGRAAWHTQTGRAQGGGQVSSAGQVRARPPALLQVKTKAPDNCPAASASQEGRGGEATQDCLLPSISCHRWETEAHS